MWWKGGGAAEGSIGFLYPPAPIYLPATAKNKDTGKYIVLTLKGQWYEIFKLFVFIEHMWARVEGFLRKTICTQGLLYYRLLWDIKS